MAKSLGVVQTIFNIVWPQFIRVVVFIYTVYCEIFFKFTLSPKFAYNLISLLNNHFFFRLRGAKGVGPGKYRNYRQFSAIIHIDRWKTKVAVSIGKQFITHSKGRQNQKILLFALPVFPFSVSVWITCILYRGLITKKKSMKNFAP
jgi:hypothetical protein